MRLILAAGLFLCCLLQSSSGQGTSDDIKAGDLIGQDKAYTHPLFHFILPLPSGWYVVSKDTEGFRLKQLEEEENNKDAVLKEYLRTEIRSLIYIQKHPEGTDPVKNTSLLMLASLLGDRAAGYGSAKEFQKSYFSGLGQLFKTEIEVLEEPQMVNVGGKEFSHFSVKVPLPGAILYKKISDAFGEGYILNIHLTAPSVEELKEVDRIIGKLLFSRPGVH